MSALTNIVRKELRELLTLTVILPIVVMALLFGSLGTAIGNVAQQAQAKPTIAVVPMDRGALGNLSLQVLAAGAKFAYNGTSVDEGLQAAQANNGVAVLYFPSNFTSSILGGNRGQVEIYWVMRGAGILDSISSGSVEALLSSVSKAISMYLIGTGVPVPANVVLAPTNRTDTTYFHGVVMTGVSPSVLGNMLASQSTFVPVIIMMIILMAGSMVITSMGMEKENKTLETLLTLPVGRGAIVAGKLIASAVIGLFMAGIYMVGFSYYIGGLSASAPVNLASYGLTLTPIDYILLGVSVFAALFAALALCMVLGTFAKNYKAAQTLTMPVTALAMLPMFMTMFWDYNTLPAAAQAIVFAIPFSHPMMAMRSLMFKDYAFVLMGIGYSFAFAVVMILIAIWIFRTDRLLTGRFTRGTANRHGRKGIWRFVNLPGR
ncbi:MAG TPA: ABC transporter permease [Thermoplasmata archaeon]|nr:ABC transporter permease [Thermoplasmata archaeon]